jgi:hypothetical protein
MAMPKKGTRRIAVGGQTYRWLASPNDGHITLLVELAEEPGQRVEAYFRYHDRYESLGVGVERIVGQARSIGPGTARAVIEAALRGGWQPARRGLDVFRIAVPDAERLVPIDGEAAEPFSCPPNLSKNTPPDGS